MNRREMLLSAAGLSASVAADPTRLFARGDPAKKRLGVVIYCLGIRSRWERSQGRDGFGEPIRFLEYLASDEAQRIFVGSSDEYPAVESAGLSHSLVALGDFETDPVNVSVYGTNQALAQMIFDRAGWN